MKYLLVLLVVVIAIGIWRSKRRVSGTSQGSTAQSTARATALNKPQAMMECAHCGLHLPQKDAVTDAQGRHYCGAEHRQAASPR